MKSTLVDVHQDGAVMVGGVPAELGRSSRHFLVLLIATPARFSHYIALDLDQRTIHRFCGQYDFDNFQNDIQYQFYFALLSNLPRMSRDIKFYWD